MAVLVSEHLTIVVLMDVISTDNCVFKNQDARQMKIIRCAAEMGFMVLLLIVQCCICTHAAEAHQGGTFFSITPFFAKKNQSYAELASRIG